MFGMSSEWNRGKRGAKVGPQNKENIVTGAGRGRNAGQSMVRALIKGGKHPRNGLEEVTF